jgi:hypothetical protein
MSSLSELIPIRERVVSAALKVVLFERAISDDSTSLNAVLKAEHELAIAARDLTNAIDDLPPGKHPKGWATNG